MYFEVDNFSGESAGGSNRRRLRDSLGGAFEKILSKGVTGDAGAKPVVSAEMGVGVKEGIVDSGADCEIIGPAESGSQDWEVLYTG